ncbi:MAG TPA: MMPL family transporter [Acidimicrobiales bacterium]|nr:MMPL family transporter [Acidimicrobiales bacterium]
MLERLASACFRHRWRVIALWGVGLVALLTASGAVGGAFADGGRLPGTDSQRAYDLVSDEMPDRSGDTATVVFHDPAGLDRPSTVAAIRSYLDEVRSQAGVASVSSPVETTSQVSAAGTVAFATVDLLPDGPVSSEQAAAAIAEKAASLERHGVEVAFGGYLFQDVEVPASEGVGLLAAVVILLVAFGSVVAMGLPIVTALAGVVASIASLALWAAVVPTPDFTTQVAMMIGIGVGIDYALFIVTRYRAALQRGLDPHAATIEAMGTAGRAVVFAGCTVMISLLGLLLMGLSFLHGLALGTSTAVLVAVVAAVTLLPAMLGLVGRRIDRLSVHRRRRTRTRETVAHRWARSVQRRPALAAAAGAGALVLLSLPVLSMRLAVADAGNDPAGSTTRRAYELLAEGFGAGVNGPLVVVMETPDAAAVAAVPRVLDAVAATPGVAMVTESVPSPSGAIAVAQAYPTTAPQSEVTEQLVRHLRDDVLPEAAGGSGLLPHVGGETASNIDFSSVLSSRLPWFIGAVLVLSFLLLLAAFRSVLVPIKAVAMNLLSIGAAYGVMVAVFQWGWFGGLLGVAGGAPIEPWAPMMLFAIVFGLSMDYEVFLLSSVKEEYERSGDNSRAVVEGLASTARVITAAAAIMVCVFGSFVVTDQRAIKLIGLGLAVAVLIDATLVRLVLVPATMELLGRTNWWFPRWLDRMVPRLTVERRPRSHQVQGDPLPAPSPAELVGSAGGTGR